MLPQRMKRRDRQDYAQIVLHFIGNIQGPRLRRSLKHFELISSMY